MVLGWGAREGGGGALGRSLGGLAGGPREVPGGPPPTVLPNRIRLPAEVCSELLGRAGRRRETLVAAESLLAAMKRTDIEELTAMIEKAVAAEVDPPAIEQARQRKADLEVHRRRRQAVKVLVAATAGQDIDALSSAIQQAEAAGVNPDSVERAARRRAALEAEARRRRAREQAESALDAVTREIEDVARASVAGRNVAGRDPPHLIEGLTRAIATAEANDVGEARLADSRKKLMAMDRLDGV